MDIHTELDPTRTYSTHEACHFAGVSYRQADYWIRKGLISGMDPLGPGSGQQRRWHAHQVVKLYEIADVLDQVEELLGKIGMSRTGWQKTGRAA